MQIYQSAGLDLCLFDGFSNFILPEDAGQQIETEVEGFGCRAARLHRNYDVMIKCFRSAWRRLKFISVGVTLGFYFDVFHCTLFFSTTANINNINKNFKISPD